MVGHEGVAAGDVQFHLRTLVLRRPELGENLAKGWPAGRPSARREPLPTEEAGSRNSICVFDAASWSTGSSEGTLGKAIPSLATADSSTSPRSAGPKSSISSRLDQIHRRRLLADGGIDADLLVLAFLRALVEHGDAESRAALGTRAGPPLEAGGTVQVMPVRAEKFDLRLFRRGRLGRGRRFARARIAQFRLLGNVGI